MTAAIHAPFGRSARHAVLEGRNLGDRARLKALTLDLAADQNPRWKADGFEGVLNESVLDTRGVAQVIELFTREDLPPPDFVYHELVLTDGAGHDYGPHHAGLRDALDESDRRIGRVLDAARLARPVRGDALRGDARTTAWRRRTSRCARTRRGTCRRSGSRRWSPSR